MSETPIDKLQGWLEREEEEFGITGAIERTFDADRCRAMLKEELGYDPSDAQVDLMLASSHYRYSELPQIGVITEMVQYPWGQQLWYRDMTTGQRLSTETVYQRLRDIGVW